MSAPDPEVTTVTVDGETCSRRGGAWRVRREVSTLTGYAWWPVPPSALPHALDALAASEARGHALLAAVETYALSVGLTDHNGAPARAHEPAEHQLFMAILDAREDP